MGISNRSLSLFITCLRQHLFAHIILRLWIKLNLLPLQARVWTAIMTDQNMPTTYETQTTSQPMSIGLHKEYLRTLPGILKMVEIVSIQVVCLKITSFSCVFYGNPHCTRKAKQTCCYVMPIFLFMFNQVSNDCHLSVWHNRCWKNIWISSMKEIHDW